MGAQQPIAPASSTTHQPKSSLKDKASTALGFLVLAYFGIAIVGGLIAVAVTYDWGAWLASWGEWFGGSGGHGNPYDGPYDSGFDCPAGPRTC
ncbi:hypothetical protein ACI799_20800 [Blastococcus sp. SYSU DS0753]